MSIATLIIGPSGTGKSTALRNLDPNNVLVLQAVRKPLPFKGSFKHYDPEAKTGNVFVMDAADKIVKAMTATKRNVIVLDDFQFTMANEFMRRSGETGFAKFTDIGRNAWDILNAANTLPDHKRVYILSHSETTDDGRIKAKTIGKLLDEKLSVEGLFSIVLRSMVRDGEYLFATKNNGADTTKTPMGMFDSDFIPNDLKAIDDSICNYYELAASA